MKKKWEPRKLFLSVIGIFLCSLAFQGLSLASPIKDMRDVPEPSTGQKIASGGLTLVYFPVKAAYAGLGGIVGGIAFVLGGGDTETAEAVWTPTINGTYVITPEHLQGERSIQFFGQPASDISDQKLSRRAKRLQRQ